MSPPRSPKASEALVVRFMTTCCTWLESAGPFLGLPRLVHPAAHDFHRQFQFLSPFANAQLQLFLSFAQCLFGSCAFRNVDQKRSYAGDGSGPIEQIMLVNLNHQPRAV